jgi:hypothetical protein
MRRTVALDQDVTRMLEMAMREKGISFQQAINDAVRTGLAQADPRGKRKFVQRTFSMGSEQYFRWDKALAAAEAMEDEEMAGNPLSDRH